MCPVKFPFLPSYPLCFLVMVPLGWDLPDQPWTFCLVRFPPASPFPLCFLAALEFLVLFPTRPPNWSLLVPFCPMWTPGGVRWGEGTVRILPSMSCPFCHCLMCLCLFCAWAHGCVFVCVGHVLPLSCLLISNYHAPLFSPSLVLICLSVVTCPSRSILVCLSVFNCSSCSPLLYFVLPFSLVLSVRYSNLFCLHLYVR